MGRELPDESQYAGRIRAEIEKYLPGAPIFTWRMNDQDIFGCTACVMTPKGEVYLFNVALTDQIVMERWDHYIALGASAANSSMKRWLELRNTTLAECTFITYALAKELKRGKTKE